MARGAQIKKKKKKEKPDGYVFGRPTLYGSNTIPAVGEYLKTCVDGYQRVQDGYRTETKKVKGKTKKMRMPTYKMVFRVNLPTIEGLAIFLGTHRDTLLEWEKQYPDFSGAVGFLRSEQARRLVAGALEGSYSSPNVIKTMLSRHGYVEKVETDNKHSVGLGSLFDQADERRKAP